jgi:hypothetical protein
VKCKDGDVMAALKESFLQEGMLLTRQTHGFFAVDGVEADK